ncbi:MAG: DUF1801 domain-containing protein [Rhodothermaceae bacterium]
MTDVENFIIQFEGEQREIMFLIHRLLTTELNLISKIRFKIPFYYNKSWICYLNPIRKGGVEFAFTRGNELSNSQKLLDSKERKQVAGIELTSAENIPLDKLNEIIQEAILLDETLPYASKRKKSIR